MGWGEECNGVLDDVKKYLQGEKWAITSVQQFEEASFDRVWADVNTQTRWQTLRGYARAEDVLLMKLQG
jgi:hypothetical protein